MAARSEPRKWFGDEPITDHKNHFLKKIISFLLFYVIAVAGFAPEGIVPCIWPNYIKVAKMINLSGNLSNASLNCPIVPCLRCQPFEDFVPPPSLHNIGSVPWGLSFNHTMGLPASSKALVASLAKTHCLCCGHFEIKVQSDRWRPLFFQPEFSVSLHNLDTY